MCVYSIIISLYSILTIEIMSTIVNIYVKIILMLVKCVLKLNYIRYTFKIIQLESRRMKSQGEKSMEKFVVKINKVWEE